MPTEDIEKDYEIIREETFPLKAFDDKIIKIIKLNTRVVYKYYLNGQKVELTFYESYKGEIDINI